MRTILALFAFALPLAAFPVPKQDKVPDLAGTTWNGDGVVAPTRYVFHAGGKMSYSYNGQTHTTGTWKQDGTKLYWECNNKYCEFEGTIDGDTVKGKAWNKVNFNKELKFKREDVK